MYPLLISTFIFITIFTLDGVQVQNDRQLVVEMQVSHGTEQYQFTYFRIKTLHSSKRAAYDGLLQKVEKVKGKLVHWLMMPSQEWLIASDLQHHYLQRSRKWEFSVYFAVYGPEAEVLPLAIKLKKLDAQSIPPRPIDGTAIKLPLFNAFFAAKQEALSLFPQLSILSIKSISYAYRQQRQQKQANRKTLQIENKSIPITDISSISICFLIGEVQDEAMSELSLSDDL